MYKTIVIPKYKRNESNMPSSGQIVIGYDEVKRKGVKVQYREDSNRFFDYPYTGDVYPIDRMHLYRELNNLEV